ncbi:MAG: cell division protein [Porticoccus sp.]|nr:cell division protein [Porticoccus sp.]
MKPKINKLYISRWRYTLLASFLLALPVAAIWHIAGLQVLADVDKGYEFLQGKVKQKLVHKESIPAYRGVITDRNGQPLAISSPVIIVSANPNQVDVNHPNFLYLADYLSLNPKSLKKRLSKNSHKIHLRLKKDLEPAKAEKIRALKISGIYMKKAYKRFYPGGELTSQIVGITNSEDKGQEGIELSFNHILAGVPGNKKVLKDRRGSVIKDLGIEKNAKPGRNITLSIDMRLQHKAYTELKEAVIKNNAKSGSVIILDIHSGEVLAMANQPSYNPNNRGRLSSEELIKGARNRAILDIYEPGSTIKPFTVLAALENEKISSEQFIDTNPGYIQIGKKIIRDHRNYGKISLDDLLKKSSNVGAIKLGIDIDPGDMHDLFSRVGFGEVVGIGFPGEVSGVLPWHKKSMKLERANLAIGYSMNATALQVARAYSVLASGGIKKPLTLQKLDSIPKGDRVVNAELVTEVRKMMMGATRSGGTAEDAAIYTYNVAGKTGTSHKNSVGGYEEKRYVSLFAGIVPAENPRLVTVVIINDPKAGQHYGGKVAGPVYANVTERALRVLRVAPKISDNKRAVVINQKVDPSQSEGDI